jgi:hypothetical protein
MDSKHKRSFKHTSDVGNLAGATYTWQIQVVRGNTVVVDWTVPTTTISGVSGTLQQTQLSPLDIINIRCVLNTANLTSNSVLDRTCPNVTSAPSQIRLPSLENLLSTTFVAGLSADNATAVLPKSGAAQTTASSSAKPLSSSLKEQPIWKGAIHTVDLLTVPNPANAQVGLRFRLPDEAIVTVEIVDALQRVVLAPAKASVMQQGEHEIVIPVGSLASGVYSVRIKANLAAGSTLAEQRPLIIVR